MARVPNQHTRDFPKPFDYVLMVVLALLCLLYLFFAPSAEAQNRIVLTPTVTSGNGELTTAISWETLPPAPGETPCTATGLPEWAGPKAASGMQTLTFSTSATLNLSCSWNGDSIVTYTWTNPTKNTDGSDYTDPKLVRIKHTFDTPAQRSDVQLAGAQCGSTPTVLCTDVPQTPAPQTMRTVTGITQTGTLRALAIAINQRDVFSEASGVATKVFTGLVTVAESVGITVNPKPEPISSFDAT
jgi:hypothetical protein